MPKRTDGGERVPGPGRARRARGLADTVTGDVALVVEGPDDVFTILRRRSADAPVEMGALRPVRQGSNLIDGELVSLHRREDLPFLYDVKVELDLRRQDGSGDDAADSATASHAGPAKVTSAQYRHGWDSIWGNRGGTGARPN